MDGDFVLYLSTMRLSVFPDPMAMLCFTDATGPCSDLHPSLQGEAGSSGRGSWDCPLEPRFPGVADADGVSGVSWLPGSLAAGHQRGSASLGRQRGAFLFSTRFCTSFLPGLCLRSNVCFDLVEDTIWT